MNELTPDLIASIASRLYNELPGANSVPKTEMDMSHMPSEAKPPVDGMPQFSPSTPSMPTSPHASLPSTPTAPPLSGASYPSIPSDGKLPSSGVAGFQPATSSLPTSVFSQTGFAGASPPGVPNVSEDSRHASPGGSGGQYHGLRSFVESIRSTHSGSAGPRDGRCLADPNTAQFQRLFSGKSLPVNGGSRPLDVNAVRRDFPILNQRVHGKPLVWFDNAATTQKPQAVIDAISRFYSHDNSNIHRGAHTLAARSTDAFEQARQRVQGFLGASSAKDIIFVRGTTEGINLIAQTYGRKFLQPGDEIVMSTLEHHANIVPWQTIAKEKGAVLRVIPVTDRGEIMMEEYQRLLNSRTKVVALTHASNSLGTILPVAEMTQMAKRYGARVMIDGAQSVAHIPVNMQELGADWYVFSGHKIFGPTGIGVVFARQEVQEIMPPWQGGGNMIRNVTFEETSFADPPAKFEAGTPNIADAVGLGAALDYLGKFGLPAIGKYEHELLEYATTRLSEIKSLRMIGTARDKVSVISFVLPDRKTEEVGKLLDMEGIAVRAGHHCSQPSLRRFGVESTVRPSFSFYNTHEEVDRLVEALKKIQRV